MIGNNNCSRCHMMIGAERLLVRPVVCDHCGHVDVQKQRAFEDKQERGYLLTIFTASIFTLAAVVHISTWGSASFQAIAFQIKDIVGMNSEIAMEEMAQSCLQRQRHDCAENLYIRLARHNPRWQVPLGKFQLARHKTKEAVETFHRFFAEGGGDINANYLFAKALSELGHLEEASKHFDYVLDSKPGVLQISVAKTYVKALMAGNQFDQARKVIQKIRKHDSSVAWFMEDEMRLINSRSTASIN